MKYLYIFLLFCCLTVKLFGQHAYGTTGLLFAPTALQCYHHLISFL